MRRPPNQITLARIRARVASFLTQRCVIEVQDTTPGDYGTIDDTWTQVAQDVPCRVLPMTSGSSSGAGMLSGDRETLVDTYRLIVPADTALDINQRVTLDTDVYYITEIITSQTDAMDAQALIKLRR